MRRPFFFLKFAVFTLIFYILCLFFAFIFKNNSDSYCRILFHELHQQKKIDVMLCGASHISNGFYPALADEILGLNTFCAGTPGQGIDGTYAIIRETAEMCELKHIYLDMDFVVSTTVFKERKGLKNTYLVSDGLKNPRVKLDFLLHASSPRLYLNSFLPIGAEKYIELDPKSTFRNLKSKLNGQYYRYSYETVSDYVGKGGNMDPEFVKNGSFYDEVEPPIPVDEISDDYINTIKKIASYCEKKGVGLTFFMLPGSDFYRAKRGNYDEYVSFVKNFTSSLGYEYYDFNLIRPEFLSFQDQDFLNGDHLSKEGVLKFTKAFCDFFYGNNGINTSSKEKFFFNSFEEKLNAQPTRILGLLLTENKETNEITISPVVNNNGGGQNASRIAYDVLINCNNETEMIAKNASQETFSLPKNKSGNLEILAYYNGEEHCHISKYFTAF